MPPLLALFAWPAVVLILAQKYRAPLACTLALLLGYLLLPTSTSFDLPVFPALTKNSIPALSVLLFMVLMGITRSRDDELSLLPKNWVVRVALLSYVLGVLMTVLTNGDYLRYGPTTLPGLRIYDGLSQVLGAIIALLPMLLARKFLARPEHHVLLLQVLCIAALGYSLLALIEVRLSPQLNMWVYGFFPHSFLQHVRSGGWRPLVFLDHGLILSLFFSMSVFAAAAMWRWESKNRGRYVAAMLWLLVILVLSKSLGALLITLMLLPVAMMLPARSQLIVAAVFAGIVLVYPMVRSAGLVPINRLHNMAEQIDPARAASLQVRLENEESLLRKAHARPIVGWGGWGRSRVYDPETGRDMSITDGYWIIALGVGGWVGYLSIFGMLCLPIALLLRRCKQYQIGVETGVLALILTANLIDLVPNSSITPITWICAGALWGRLELGRVEAGAGIPESLGARPSIPFSRRDLPARSGKAGMMADADGETARAPRYSRQKVQHERRRG